MTTAKGGCEARECSVPEKPTGSNRSPAVLTQLVPGTDTLTPELGSRNVPGLAGETITSAGNRLVHSGLQTSRKPPEPGLSKPTCVGTGGSETPIQTSGIISGGHVIYPQPMTFRALHL